MSSSLNWSFVEIQYIGVFGSLSILAMAFWGQFCHVWLWRWGVTWLELVIRTEIVWPALNDRIGRSPWARLKALVWFWIIDETLVLTSMLSVCRLNEVGTCQVLEQEMIMVMTTR